MRTLTLIKRWALTTAILGMNVTNVWALESAREDNSDLFVWIFLAFCALIVIAQLIPAIMMMLGVAKGVKKETLEVIPAAADQETAPDGQYESEV